jgi:tetratricopeptide (TPR) repeat protein
MLETNSSPLKHWTYQRALLLMAICLMAGIAGGWAIRGSRPTPAESTKVVSSPPVAPATTAAQPQSPAQLRAMADAQAAPQLLKLKSDPKNPELLTSVGNVYYDAQQYSVAVDYYRRVLQINASDAAVRTDMATAYWYMGNANTAIAEFNRALTYAPNNANTLFNLGLVMWQGKHDSAGAITEWKKLLATNPNYESKDKVEQMLSDVEKQVTAKPGTKG